MDSNIERGVINASNDIISYGLDNYFNNGVNYGFFKENDDKYEILEGIIKTLQHFDRDDFIIELIKQRK